MSMGKEGGGRFIRSSKLRIDLWDPLADHFAIVRATTRGLRRSPINGGEEKRVE